MQKLALALLALVLAGGVFTACSTTPQQDVPTSPSIPTQIPTLPVPPTPSAIPILRLQWEEGNGLHAIKGIVKIVIDPKDEQTLYALEEAGLSVQNVWKAENGGKNWMFVGERRFTYRSTSDRPNDREIATVSGVHVPESRNLREELNPHWTKVFHRDISPHMITSQELESRGPELLIKDRDVLFMQLVALPVGQAPPVRSTTTNRFLVSLDGGKSWVEILAPPLGNLEAYSIAVVDSQEIVKLYVGTRTGKVWYTEIKGPLY